MEVLLNNICDKHCLSGLDPDSNLDDDEEKQRLISQVLELQNTLDGKSTLPTGFVVTKQR